MAQEEKRGIDGLADSMKGVLSLMETYVHDYADKQVILIAEKAKIPMPEEENAIQLLRFVYEAALADGIKSGMKRALEQLSTSPEFGDGLDEST